MRVADACALHALMTDAVFLRKCHRVVGEPNLAAMRANYADLLDDATIDLGRTVETLTRSYGAPHLRPVHIRSEQCDAACWGTYALLNYSKLLLK